MPIYSYKDFEPEISNGCFIAPSADIIGRVKMSENSNLWYQVVARGDVNEILIGKDSNIQDLCVLHVTEEEPLIIGSGVSVGHSATLHACTVGDNSLIGMSSTILDGAVIGKNSLVAAGSLVSPGKKFPDGVMIMGSPAKVVRPLTQDELITYGEHYKAYIKYKDEFLDKKTVKVLSKSHFAET